MVKLANTPGLSPDAVKGLSVQVRLGVPQGQNERKNTRNIRHPAGRMWGGHCGSQQVP